MMRMNVPEKYDKESFLERAIGYLCTGVMAALCVLWGLVLLVLYLLFLIVFHCVRLFDPEG